MVSLSSPNVERSASPPTSLMLIAVQMLCLPLNVSSCHGHSSLHVRMQHDICHDARKCNVSTVNAHVHAHPAMSISVLLLVHRHDPALSANMFFQPALVSCLR